MKREPGGSAAETGTAEAPRATRGRRRKFTVFSIVTVLAIVADQWTKVLARRVLKPLGHGHVTVVDGFWDHRYSENTGVAFGMFQSQAGLGRLLLSAVAAAAFLIVIQYLRKAADDQRRLHVALGLVGGGAIGNLVDRIAFGRVTDFIVWHVGLHEWPAFNVADAALVAGVGLMALDMLPGRRPRPPDGKKT